MSSKKHKLTVQPPSARPQYLWRGKSNHKGDKLQLWDIEHMRNALILYFSQRGFLGKPFGYKCIVDAYNISQETFHRRVKGHLEAFLDI